MHIQSTPASNGIRWLTQGFELWWRQPLGLPAMAVIYLLMYLPAAIPFVGAIPAAVLAPYATIGLMNACRDIAAKRSPTPEAFIKPFQNAAQRQLLFRLGFANAALSMVAIVLVNVLAGNQPVILKGVGPDGADALNTARLAWQLAVYLPIAIVMWFAPMLTGWHAAPPLKAMFGSLVACWQNKWAMLIYALALSATIGVAVTVVGILISALGASNALISLLAAPLALICLSVSQAGVYSMYVAIFEQSSDSQLQNHAAQINNGQP